jgi:MerR family transcriptional regulator, light-induced transcriptional regulator
MKETEPQLSIAAVEREVGLSKDVLRVWERRYGFPVPLRDRNHERLYPADQVRRLRLVKRLMDLGHRPGRLLARPPEELERLAAEPALPQRAGKTAPGVEGSSAHELLESLRLQDAEGLARMLMQHLAREGLARFVQDILAPMTVHVGDEWAHGRLQVFEEHLFTETCARILRQAIAAVPPGRAPTVLLTTAPEEPHALGLLMVESLLALQGARCIGLGTQTPLTDVVSAARACRADVVALSFSSAFPARRASQVLQELRLALPPPSEVWAGGAAVRRLGAIEGVRVLPGLGDAVAAVQAWQERH